MLIDKLVTRLVKNFPIFYTTRIFIIVSGYGLDDRVIEVRFPAESNDFSFSLCVQTGSGAHPTSCTMGTRGDFKGTKERPEREADYSPPI
jgi:hypothetical protein